MAEILRFVLVRWHRPSNECWATEVTESERLVGGRTVYVRTEAQGHLTQVDPGWDATQLAEYFGAMLSISPSAVALVEVSDD